MSDVYPIITILNINSQLLNLNNLSDFQIEQTSKNIWSCCIVNDLLGIFVHMVQGSKQNIPPNHHCLYKTSVLSNYHDNFSDCYQELYEDKKS
jgi:hypothetical protein